jgi:hypothetical protein
MTSSSTIIGITRQQPDGAEFPTADEGKPLSLNTSDASDDLIVETPQGSHDAGENTYQDYYEEEDVNTSSWKTLILPGTLVATFAAWTGYFIWVHSAENWAVLSGDRIVSLIGSWAIPALLIAVAWLIMLRSSRAEAARFGDVASLLRTESEALQVRMRTVNEEIAMAREFLAQNARELESVGRQAASKLNEAAQQLSVALADSDAKAKTLEQVSNAAATNLEQLRKHLPVVTSAAKDVTNQIGSAGNSAQLQVKTLIAGLQRVADAGVTARENIEGLEVRAGEAAIQLSHIITQNAKAFETSVNDASSRTTAITLLLNDAQGKITNGLANANEDIDALVEINLSKLTQQVEMLRESLSDLSTQSKTEDSRVTAMIDRISAHIDDRTGILADLDAASTDRTVKLAFAVEALVASTNALNQSLDQSGENTSKLSQHSEALLSALQIAKNELDVSLPDSFSRAEQRLVISLSQIESATQGAMKLDGVSDDLLAKLSTIQNLISTQGDAVSGLMMASDTQFAAQQEQTDALAAALVETRGMMEHLAESANNDLVVALNKVRDSTQEAAEASRLILDDEMSSVAERLTVQSRQALASAIDGQVAALNDMVQKSLEDNIATSQQATQQITRQLAEIDLMTGSLEARISNAREGFSGLDDDSFARQMVTLTESLNSTAIDVAKILSNEVTDTSWAAYLKGDRGVFTRRAVRLLDTNEAKTIATHYSEDAEFREHVNRYIHDFESMMRVLLSTRDGNAIGVTLLSSDVGKLYVALAQSIERLRN